MKRLTIFTFLCFLALFSFAQDDADVFTRHEVSVGYGANPISSMYWGSHIDYHFDKNKEFIGAFYATYTYRFTPVVGIGGTFAVDPRVHRYKDKATPGLGTIARVDQTAASLLFHLKLNWLNRRVVTLYSKLGAGACFCGVFIKNNYPELYEVDSNTSPINFAYTIVPVGIEIGNKQYAGFLQIGLGMEGFISAGFRYGFKKTQRK